LGMKYGIANKTGQPSNQEISKIIAIALNNGIRFFDTAQSYGESEVILGDIFEKLTERSEVKLITKLAPDFQHENVDQLRSSIDSSLTRLKMSSLWGLMTHRSSSVTDWERFSKHINSLDSGKLVQHFGVSLYSPEEAMKFVDNEFIDIIQIPTNILDKRLIRNGFFERAIENNKIIFIRSVFLQGLLLLNESDLEKRKMGWAKEHLKFYHEFLRRNELLPQYFTLKAIRQRFPELILVSGVETQMQLMDNLEILKSPDLEQSILNEWWSILPDLPIELLDPSKWGV